MTLGGGQVVQTLPGAMTITDDVLILAQAARLLPQKSYKEKEPNRGAFHLLCTMSAGFDEDGLEVILEAFGELKTRVPHTILTIKCPNLPEIASACFVEHNDQSRRYKLQGPLRKNEFDQLRLERSVRNSRAAASIRIVRENLSIREFMDLLGRSDCFLSATRGNAVCVDIIGSLALGIPVVLPEHIALPLSANEARPYTSQKGRFSEIFNVPETSATLKLQAYRPSGTALLSVLEQLAKDSPVAQSHDSVSWSEVRLDLDETIKSVFGVSRWD